MDIYGQLGLTPIINACGAVTRLGGAPMPSNVLNAFMAAASQTVCLEQLHAAASARIAEATQTEAGLVTAGSAASLTLGAAAILAGYDLARMESLPDCSGFANEFVVSRDQRSGYDHSVRAAGAQLREVGFNEVVAGAGVRRTEAWEYSAAFNEKTAGVLYVLTPTSAPELREVVQRAHDANLPVLVDAAGELPPRSNLHTIAASGADLVGFSGGKAIRGPQSTGILCGKRDLIASAALQMLDMDDHHELWSPPKAWVDKNKLDGLPRHGIGRALKVSKEEIAALIAALESFQRGDYLKELDEMRGRLQQIVDSVSSLPLSCQLIESQTERPPILQLCVDEGCTMSAVEICRALRQASPPTYVGHGGLSEGRLEINPLCLSRDQADTIASQLTALLAPG